MPGGYVGRIVNDGPGEHLLAANSTQAVMKGTFVDPLTISYEVCALS